MDEKTARQFYALALPYGCARGDCPTENIVVDLVFRLQDYRKVGQDCLGGECESRLAHVYNLLGFRLRVADAIKLSSNKEVAFAPRQVLVETIYQKPK